MQMQKQHSQCKTSQFSHLGRLVRKSIFAELSTSTIFWIKGFVCMKHWVSRKFLYIIEGIGKCKHTVKNSELLTRLYHSCNLHCIVSIDWMSSAHTYSRGQQDFYSQIKWVSAFAFSHVLKICFAGFFD